MVERQIKVFFYGLFMDADLLRTKGIVAVNQRPAKLDGFGLRIGRRATLVPANDECSYGVVMSLTRQDLRTLYSAPGLEEYVPETVSCMTLTGERVSALCYNLKKPPGPAEANSEYARQLRDVLTKLRFPEEYIDRIG
jgi:Gamma-glutamyl cyclotransferase, AIG2-like